MNEMNSKRLVSKRLVSKQLVSKRLVKKDDIDEKRAQADVSSLHREAVISVIIIARWRLHVQVCTFGESTEMKAHCIVSKECQLEIAVRAESRRMVVRKQVGLKRSKKSRPVSC